MLFFSRAAASALPPSGPRSLAQRLQRKEQEQKKGRQVSTNIPLAIYLGSLLRVAGNLKSNFLLQVLDCRILFQHVSKSFAAIWPDLVAHDTAKKGREEMKTG